tara:strand:+ start:78 stop:2321 length:2244 start_codon:yes stop_codon:yes gene_type:complete
MGFIQDRFQETARWILNPRVFWNGFQLSSYLESEVTLSLFELNSLKHAQYDWRRHLDLVTNFEEVIVLDKLSDTLTTIANSPPTTFWELKTNHHKSWNPKLGYPDYVLPGFSLLSSNRSKPKLLRNIYSNDTLQAWIHSNNNAAVESMSNEPTIENGNYANWIARMLYCLNVSESAPGRHNQTYKLENNSTNILLITSLPNFLISKSTMISDFPEDELGLPDNTEDMEFNLSVSPGKQYQTFELLPPILINPQWLHITGWADLWTGTLPRTQTFITTMNHSSTCRFCVDGTVACETCEEGYNECPECGGAHHSYCDNCEQGWIDCETCDNGTLDCSDCLGDGTTVCQTCEGNGVQECLADGCEAGQKTVCELCEGTGWEDDTRTTECNSCEGLGSVEARDCTTCEGEGTRPCDNECDEGQEDCGTCDGDGTVICPDCDGDGGESCEEGCDEGIFYCQYCEEGYSSCDECEGDYEFGSCSMNVYENIWNESIDTTIMRNYDEKSQGKTRQNALTELLSIVRPLPTSQGDFNILQEVYGNISFEFLTMTEIWKRFLLVMQENIDKKLYFFNPTPLGISIVYATSDVLAHLDWNIRSSTTIYHDGDERQIIGNTHNKDRFMLPFIPDRTLTTAPIRKPIENFVESEKSGGLEFRTQFNIECSSEDLIYWNLFWNQFSNMLHPLMGTLLKRADSSGVSYGVGRMNNDYFEVSAGVPIDTIPTPTEKLSNFKFLLGTSSSTVPIVALNYPKG